MGPSPSSVENLYLYDPDLKAEADGFVREAPKTSAARRVYDLASLEIRQRKHLRHVRFLIFDMPGGPGKIQLHDGRHVGVGLLGLLAAKNPRFVGAATSKTFVNVLGPFVLRKTHIPFWSDLRVFRYDATWARVDSIEK